MRKNERRTVPDTVGTRHGRKYLTGSKYGIALYAVYKKEGRGGAGWKASSMAILPFLMETGLG